MTNQEFIESIAGYVQAYAPQYDICVNSPIIAQAVLESGWGNSTLGSVYHNYFGLKCGTKWTGKSVNMNTQEEYIAGTLTTISDNFRVFDSMEDGVRGYFEFIQLQRYQNLKGITDPQTYLETIKADGYATSSTYVQSNMSIIEQYNLTQYDGAGGGSDGSADRNKPVEWLAQYVGVVEGSTGHKEILRVFNDSGLCSRYKMTVNDAWCATAVSAAFIATGLSGIFPCVECSCENMINLAKNAGIWVEDDSYTPATGDVILYDWDDNGEGDCTGWSDHVGIVTGVDASTIHVIEGNISSTVGYRDIAVNGRYIRGFITPKYSGARPSGTSGGKSISTVASEVLAGLWGNGEERKARLQSAGYDYPQVQAEVNRLCGKSTSGSTSKSIEQIAQEVIAGSWGNGADRQRALQNAGYNYTEVQAKVNELLSGGSKSSSSNLTSVAKAVIRGDYGNGQDRINRLRSAGYDPTAVQTLVNQLMG